jgi:hypothetical protein
MWQRPGEHTRLALLQMPASGLLGLVVVPAERSQVAFASSATAMIGGRVVIIASGRGPTAAGKPAGPLTDSDQVTQRARGAVTRNLTLVGALPRLQGHWPQAAQPASYEGGAGRPGTMPGTGVRDRVAITIGEGQAPMGSRMGGQPCGEVTTGVSVCGTEAGDFSGRL